MTKYFERNDVDVNLIDFDDVTTVPIIGNETDVSDLPVVDEDAVMTEVVSDQKVVEIENEVLNKESDVSLIDLIDKNESPVKSEPSCTYKRMEKQSDCVDLTIIEENVRNTGPQDIIAKSNEAHTADNDGKDSNKLQDQKNQEPVNDVNINASVDNCEEMQKEERQTESILIEKSELLENVIATFVDKTKNEQPLISGTTNGMEISDANPELGSDSDIPEEVRYHTRLSAKIFNLPRAVTFFLPPVFVFYLNINLFTSFLILVNKILVTLFLS